MTKIKSLQINLPTIITPSGNETRQWDRNREFWKFKQEKELYRGVFRLCGAWAETYKCEPKAKRSVEFRSFRYKLLDDDNLIQGFKMLRDVLEEIGIIYKDSPKYLEAHYSQEVDRKNLRTEIVVRDVDV